VGSLKLEKSGTKGGTKPRAQSVYALRGPKLDNAEGEGKRLSKSMQMFGGGDRGGAWNGLVVLKILINDLV